MTNSLISESNLFQNLVFTFKTLFSLVHMLRGRYGNFEKEVRRKENKKNADLKILNKSKTYIFWKFSKMLIGFRRKITFSHYLIPMTKLWSNPSKSKNCGDVFYKPNFKTKMLLNIFFEIVLWKIYKKSYVRCFEK